MSDKAYVLKIIKSVLYEVIKSEPYGSPFFEEISEKLYNYMITINSQSIGEKENGTTTTVKPRVQ